MAQELILLSPEKTVLSIRLASLASRVLAHVLDLFIYVVLVAATYMVLGILSVANAIDMQAVNALFMFLSLSGLFLYFILFEALWNGQTLGKKAAGIRVRMADGTPVTPQAAIGRNLVRPADLLPTAYFLGLVAMFTNTKSQRIGDLAANTIVVHDRRPQPIFQPAPYVLGEHRFESQVGDLTGMTLAEYVALKRFCDRYPELSAASQGRFVGEVWDPFARRRGVPSLPGVHPLQLAEAVVMKYGRIHGLL
ncbi:MAG: RDD family protein [Armatimonadetes bacterium]|nr:RDD family protein [Armatimonadota bacterium]